MGYFIRPIVLQEMKRQCCIHYNYKDYSENHNKPFNHGWIHKVINRVFTGLYENKYKMEDLFFRGLGHIISDCDQDIRNKYFNVYCKEGGDIYDRVYELKDIDVEWEYSSRKHKKDINTNYGKIKEESLDKMFEDLYQSYQKKCGGTANDTEEFKIECKEQLRMMLNSGFDYWVYH